VTVKPGFALTLPLHRWPIPSLTAGRRPTWAFSCRRAHSRAAPISPQTDLVI